MGVGQKGMGTCRYCGESSPVISRSIGFCSRCIRDHFQQVWPEIRKVHVRSRREYGLPEEPPQAPEGVPCSLCVRACRIPEGGMGYCGLRRVVGGRIVGGRPHEGNLTYYYDTLPTNCVGGFVCAGGTGCGYPRYAVSPGPEYGYANLAVFYHACSFNCLYCQNYQFKAETHSAHRVRARELAGAVDGRTNCICYFGGDPSPQILHALKASRLAIQAEDGRILRICWETNGAVDERFLGDMAELSMKSGGCIKFDLKGWDDGIHRALCDATNRRTLENFSRLAKLGEGRRDPPFLIASTLLVPGYIDEEEVGQLAAFIARLNPSIPYSLLGFYPHFYLNDLPRTSRSHAHRCKVAAERAGLAHVHIGNVHLLGTSYE